MQNFILSSVKKFFKETLNLVIIFQLVVYPFVSTANIPSVTKKEQESLEQASQFNKAHVQSLRELIFDTAETNRDYYENHPLDTFAILQQKVHYNSLVLPQKEKQLEQLQSQHEEMKKRLNNLESQNSEIEANLILAETQDSESVKIGELEGKQIKTQELIDQQEDQIEKKEKEISIKIGELEGEQIKIQELIDQQEDQIEKKEKEISIQTTQVNKLKQKKITDRRQARHFLVEVFEDTAEKDLKAVLAHPNQIAIAPLVLEDRAKFNGSIYKNETQKRLSFRLSYKGQTLNSFPQNIEWLAFFDNFLIFLEASKVSSQKALISFIDLKYFEEAIGHTALPVFYIPLHFKKIGLTKSAVLSPQNLSLTEDKKLILDNLSLSLAQINYLSQLQQISFNITVSLLDPETAQTSQKYLKEIVNNFEQSMEKSAFLEEPQAQNISLDTKKLVLLLLENRRKIGSAKNTSGNYGKLNKLSTSLSFLKEENETVSEFKNSLIADTSFQANIESISNQVNQQKKFYHRFFLFLNHISRPQPLGAPKIEKALGLIANSVSLKNDSIQNRFLAFKSAVSHFLHKPSQHRALTTGVLIGAGMIASPEFANYSLIALETMGQWLTNWVELFTITTQNSFEWIRNSDGEWISSDGIYNAYLEGDKPVHLMEGLIALFSIGIGFIGTLHLSVNFHDMVKHLRSQKNQLRQKKVTGLLKQFKSLKNNFINYIEKNHTEFIHNLSNAENKKLGLPITIKLGLNQIKSRQILKTVSNLDSLYSILESDKNLSLEINSQTEDQYIALELKSSKEQNQSLSDNQVSISLTHNNTEVERTFTLSEGELKYLLDSSAEKINPDLPLEIELSGKDSHISGFLQNADFTLKDHEKVNKILTEIERKTGKALISSDDFLSELEIKTLKQATAHLLVGYSSWAKTFRFLGLSWNWFFFSRSIYITPVTLMKILYYSQYFKTIHEDSHIATLWNGGKESRFNRLWSLNITHQEMSSKNLKDFESQMIQIEKLFLKEAEAQAYLELVKLAGETPTEIKILSKGSNSLKIHDIKDQRLRAFYGIYKRELFQAVMQDYLLDLTDSKENNINDGKLKLKSLERFIANDVFFEKKPSQTEIRQRVERVAQKRQIAQESLQAVDNLMTGLLKRISTMSEESSKKDLDPKQNLQMERFDTAKKLLNDPEAVSRATRQQMASFVIDKPLEVFFTFLFLAGVDQGILQILHDKPFTEEAWFHLSRYAIWSGFFTGVIMDILGGVWLKVQMDSRLDATQGFDVIPSKIAVKKRLGFLKWLKTQFMSEDNTLWENYKFSWKIVISNLPAAFLTFGIVHFATLGRFDLELFISIYLILLFPFLGLQFKIENTFEKSANWSLKELIKGGLDLKGKDRRFLSHPAIQKIKVKESGKLRIWFNFWYAFLYQNPVGNMQDIFQSINTSLGSRGFARMFFSGGLPTEYWANFMDFLENKEILSSDFAEKCKSIFTNNRTDI